MCMPYGQTGSPSSSTCHRRTGSWVAARGRSGKSAAAALGAEGLREVGGGGARAGDPGRSGPEAA